MGPVRVVSPLRLLARDCARAVDDVYTAYQESFRDAGRRAAQNFERRDWAAVRSEARERLTSYNAHVERAIAEVRARAHSASADHTTWTAMRESFAGQMQGRPDQEIGETFFSSVSRRHFSTVGVDRRVEFLRPWLSKPPSVASDAERRWCDGTGGPVALATAILEGIPHPLADRQDDAGRVARVIARAALTTWGDGRMDGAELLTSLFYRNKGAYLVGRLRNGARTLPVVLALVSTPRGVMVDAVLTSADEASVVFGFAWSYFHVDALRPSATVSYLQELMPLKRIDELYTAIGHNKHGKTELYRTINHHLSHADARFEDAEGTKGLVMAVFTLPSLNIVLKMIKDVIGAPKRTTRQAVMDQYHRVFLLDRVGRLADAQLFQGLEFPRRCFSDQLLDELLRVAPSAVQADGNRVILRHLYTERRVRPLNLYVQEVSDTAAVAAILDYGQAIKDLAIADIFPGDLLLKNFGVSRHGRVIFYDYDELAAEPWFSVAENDVFPEEFTPFLVPEGPLRDAFLSAHGDLLDPDWWRATQERNRAGELVDTFPYPAARRIRRVRE